MKTIVLNIKWVKNTNKQLHTKHTFEMTENLTVLQLRKNTAEYIGSRLSREVGLDEVKIETTGADNRKIVLEDFYYGAQFSVEGYFYQSSHFKNNRSIDCLIVDVC